MMKITFSLISWGSVAVGYCSLVVLTFRQLCFWTLTTWTETLAPSIPSKWLILCRSMIIPRETHGRKVELNLKLKTKTEYLQRSKLINFDNVIERNNLSGKAGMRELNQIFLELLSLRGRSIPSEKNGEIVTRVRR